MQDKTCSLLFIYLARSHKEYGGKPKILREATQEYGGKPKILREATQGYEGKPKILSEAGVRLEYMYEYGRKSAGKPKYEHIFRGNSKV